VWCLALSAGVATIVLQYIVKAGAVLLFAVTLQLAIPFLDLSMLFVELLSAVSSSGISSKRAEHATAFQNFLLQYQTIRIPSECFLESLPQAAFQGWVGGWPLYNQTSACCMLGAAPTCCMGAWSATWH
jgi:hypothetical protein